MRINELRDKIDKLGQKYNKNFTIESHRDCYDNKYIRVCADFSNGTCEIASIKLEKRYSFSTAWRAFSELPEALQEELLNLIIEFARTPVEEREEEKRYQYRLKEIYWWMSDKTLMDYQYLNLRSYECNKKKILLNTNKDCIGYKAKFTDKEIQEVVKEFDVDLTMFDKIEVLDE